MENLEDAAVNEPAMTEQQRRLSRAGLGRLARYRDFVSGNGGLLSWLAFEFYQFFLSNMSGLLGYALRPVLLKRFLAASGSGLTIGRGLTIRQPKNISLGKACVIDDYAVLDVRTANFKGEAARIELGQSCFLGRFSTIAAKGGPIVLGDAVNISSHCRIASQSRIEIGDSVLIASYVYIGPGNHRTEDADKPIMEQGMEIRDGVKIGSNTWIGARASILDGVKIGRDVIVGAHSLVTEDVPDRAVVVGVPARVLRIRD